jgi:hypothetical protein
MKNENLGRPRQNEEKKVVRGFTIDPTIYLRFKVYCHSNGMSMSGLLEEFMDSIVHTARMNFLVKNEDL